MAQLASANILNTMDLELVAVEKDISLHDDVVAQTWADDTPQS